MSEFFSRSDFKPFERQFQVVEIDGVKYRLETKSTSEWRKLEATMTDKRGNTIRDRALRNDTLSVAYCLVDAGGKRLFTDDEIFNSLVPDMDLLDVRVLKALDEAVRKLTGWDRSADWKAIEDEIKNSPAETSGDSSS